MNKYLNKVTIEGILTVLAFIVIALAIAADLMEVVG